MANGVLIYVEVEVEGWQVDEVDESPDQVEVVAFDERVKVFARGECHQWRMVAQIGGGGRRVRRIRLETLAYGRKNATQVLARVADRLEGLTEIRPVDVDSVERVADDEVFDSACEYAVQLVRRRVEREEVVWSQRDQELHVRILPSQ